MIRLSVKVTPKASADRIQGWAEDEKGERVLKIAVTAVPEDGKANKAVIALLAKRLKLPKSAIEIASGATDRRKTLLIDGDPALLAQLGISGVNSDARYSEERSDDPEGAGAKVPRFRAAAQPTSGKDRREATPRK